MRFDTDGQCYIAEGPRDFDGWTILAVLPWKEGVVKVHMRALNTMMIVFSNTEYVPDWPEVTVKDA